MTQALEHLRQEVREVASTVDSAIVFIDGVVERLRAALTGGDTESDVEALADELEAAKLKLASAVAANTASEDDSAEEEADHGPIDDSATAPEGGEPATDSSQQPEGGEPVEEEGGVAGGAGDATPLVNQAPSEDTPGDVDRVPAGSEPPVTTGNPDLPAADDTAGQISGDE